MNSADHDSTQWILLRGLAREARHWGAFPDLLSQAISQRAISSRVDCIDLPGSGRYSEMRSPISIADMTEFVRLKFLEIRERQRAAGEKPARKSFLVAVSLGGMVAAHWLERWPEDFAGCVVINTSFRKYSPIHHRLTPAAYFHILKIMRSKDPVERETHVLEMISNRPEIRAETAKLWASYALERPVSQENFARQLVAAARYEPKLKAPPVPTLILNSVHDHMVNPQCSLKIAKLWNAELDRHPTAGHDLPLDDAPWVVDKINEWWRRHF